ncbi:MAG: outer membrane protein assembly factor BamA [Burkholderiales bacterium]|nr:outer membrane protein assembly factor BamA [Burkholderiales bacterium]
MRMNRLRLAFFVFFSSLSFSISFNAQAIEPFIVKDIRVEGIQRTEAGTVFSYLPIKVGDTVDDEKAAAAIKSLYATGFFKDVRLEAENGVLLVMVQERPAIASIEITGNKEFETEQLKTGLKQVGLAESRIFDKALLDRAEQELKRQYISRGRYGASVTTTTTPLERNRVAINFAINEGDVTKIRQISIIGNKTFTEKELRSVFILRTPGLFTWFTDNDQYSKQKLSADLENLRSYYLNRGYLEFAIDSTQVSITPDKKDIYITVNVSEGPKYTVADIKLAGELLVPEEELRKLIKLEPGEVFSRQRLTESTKLIGDRLGDDGYAFANVNAAPELDKANQQVSFTFFVDPGRRVYVRRVNISGNTRTRDEVIRRELRQMESGWYSSEKLNRSKQRVDKLGFFSEVNVETPAVPATSDQVDINMSVVERPTGNILLGAGLSSSDGLILSGSIAQNNVFGSGNQLSLQINSGRINSVYSVSYTNPYYTVDGISRGFDIYRRDVDPTSLSVGSFRTSTLGAGIRFGVPISERDTINYGLAFESTELDVFADSPQRFKDFVTTFGNDNTTLLGSIGFTRDGRDSLIYPTSGTLQRVSAEIGLPGADLKYYKLSYQHQKYFPLSRTFTLLLNGELGAGGGYDDMPLPFFKNFFAGGNNSVRGYDTSSLGPRDTNGDALGGRYRIVGNAELLFPFPGVTDDKSLRMSTFIDAGTVDETFSVSEMRYSIGIAVAWVSPVGPLKVSIAQPINDDPGDEVQRFQFVFGTAF